MQNKKNLFVVAGKVVVLKMKKMKNNSSNPNNYNNNNNNKIKKIKKKKMNIIVVGVGKKIQRKIQFKFKNKNILKLINDKNE